MTKKLSKAAERHKRKFRSLLHEHNIFTGIANNPNETITNLTGDTITKEEESILRFGFKHDNPLPDSYTKQQKIKHSIKALACNILDFDDKRLYDDHKRIKILRNMNEKYAILKPDKGSGVVLLSKEGYEFHDRIILRYL